MSKYKDDLSFEYVQSRLDYNPATGNFYWKPIEATTPHQRSWNTRYAGTLAGAYSKQHIVICLPDPAGKKKRYAAHRLAWLIHYGEWPEDEVDHRDRDGFNNCIDNLRAATHLQNMRNRSIHKNNTSGHRGIYWDASRNKWAVEIHVDHKKIYIGRYDSDDEAIEARDKAALEHFKEFNPLRT